MASHDLTGRLPHFCVAPHVSQSSWKYFLSALVSAVVCLLSWRRWRPARFASLTMTTEKNIAAVPSGSSKKACCAVVAPPNLLEVLMLENSIIIALIAQNLTHRDISGARRASHLLAGSLAPDRVLPCIAALCADELELSRRLGLHEVLGSGDAVRAGTVMDAAFTDALRLGGALDVALVSPDSRGRTPLLVAVQRKLPEAVKVLLRLGAPPDRGDSSSGWSPLMFAINSGSEVMARDLVKHGASVNFVARPHGYTPIMAALTMADEKLTEWLLSAGATPQNTLNCLMSNFSHFGKEYEVLQRVLDRKINM
eukprot:TRINITY_DN66550_c0_g1_i1.p1 TRINITY_DN66550_c0_g1~~TRINITY_DN66550_c0_g1_i1.p1  ORF type:complete len:311 (-),score=34.71 TRINITY_DN66550_c0_g1_i1:210-1142(-)